MFGVKTNQEFLLRFGLKLGLRLRLESDDRVNIRVLD